MATANRVDARPASSVDYLVDENASRIEVEDNSQVTLADDFEDTVGATGPSNWWMTGLVALGIVAAILLGLQLLLFLLIGNRTRTADQRNRAPRLRWGHRRFLACL